MKSDKVAIDVQDLSLGPIFQSLLDNGGEVFRTSSRRKAILIGRSAVAELTKKYSLRLEDGPNGVRVLKD